MNPEIRKMSLKDRESVINILNKTKEFKPFEVEIAIELIDAYLEKGDASGYPTLVAEESGRILGYICYGPTPLTENTWDIYWIAVSPEFKGMGIGTRLMKYTEHEIKKKYGRLILIETSSITEYEPTRRFYAGIGYTVICRIPDFYSSGDDKIIFQKRLI